MHILILNWRDPKNPKAGGAELVTMEHAKAWVKAGHKVTWFTSSFKDSKKQEEIEGVTIVRKGSPISVLLLAPFFYFFSKNTFDIVIDEIHGLPFLTPLYIRKPIVGFIHEVAGNIWDAMYPFPLSLMGKILEKFFFLPYRLVPFITVSNSTKEDLIQMGIEPTYIHVISNGLSTPVVTLLSEKYSRHTYLFVSRLVKMKGIEDVLRSFALIRQQDKNAQLLILGTGEKEYVKELKDLAQQLHIDKHVVFKGFVREKEKLSIMGKAHLLLHASVKEGWGLVVIEAASQGTPSVVYNSAGLRDSVLHNKTGIIVEKNSPEAIAHESLALVSNQTKYKSMQQECLKWAKSLEWKASIQKSLMLIKKIS